MFVRRSCVLDVFARDGRAAAMTLSFEPHDEEVEELLDARFPDAAWTRAVLRRSAMAIEFERLEQGAWSRSAPLSIRIAAEP